MFSEPRPPDVSNPLVTALAYTGFAASDLERWATFATSIAGLAVSNRGDDGTLHLRMDERPYRLVVHPGDADDLVYLGWDVPSLAALDALAARLAAGGFAVEPADAAIAAERGASAVLVAYDAGGVRNEFAVGLAPAAEPFVSPRALHGFVTGAGGVGHVVLAVADGDATARFYRDALGLRVSDYIEFEREPGMSMRLTFLHCNERHHSLAFVERPHAPRRISHLMLEMAALDDVGRTFALCERDGVPIAMTLGRHTNDEMISFYLVSPSGFNIEIGYGGKLIDDATWEVAHYDATSVWGHTRQPEGARR
jgi:3,4-dihydroxy-9,10-secoandrosta-1,3,5(10)-triene-9,17-dione 4,5-dioxygenase